MKRSTTYTQTVREAIPHTLRVINTLKIPVYNSRALAGDEPGYIGNIIYDRNVQTFFGHDGTTWVPFGGGDTVTNAEYVLTSANGSLPNSRVMGDGIGTLVTTAGGAVRTDLDSTVIGGGDAAGRAAVGIVPAAVGQQLQLRTITGDGTVSVSEVGGLITITGTGGGGGGSPGGENLQETLEIGDFSGNNDIVMTGDGAGQTSNIIMQAVNGARSDLLFQGGADSVASGRQGVISLDDDTTAIPNVPLAMSSDSGTGSYGIPVDNISIGYTPPGLDFTNFARLVAQNTSTTYAGGGLNVGNNVLVQGGIPTDVGPVPVEVGGSVYIRGGDVEDNGSTTTTSGSVYISNGYTPQSPGTGVAGTVTIYTVDEPLVESGLISIKTGDSAGDDSGPIFIGSGESGTSGNLNLYSGTSSGESGSIVMRSGAAPQSGAVYIASGSGATKSGDVFLFSSSSDNLSGSVTVATGETSGGGTTGSITVTTGAEGTTGNLNLNTGSTTTDASGSIQMITGDAPSNNSGDVVIGSGNCDNDSGSVTIGSNVNASPNEVANSGDVLISSGDAELTSGDIGLNTGDCLDDTGDITIGSGNSTAALSGDIRISSGTGTSGSGVITISSGEAPGSLSGALTISSGNGLGGAGNITLRTGDSGDISGITGNIELNTGLTDPTIPGGEILLHAQQPHIVTSSNTPSQSPPTNLTIDYDGDSYNAPTGAFGTDTAFVFTIQRISPTGDEEICVISFGMQYSLPPVITLTPASQGAVDAQLYLDTVGTAQFRIRGRTVPSAPMTIHVHVIAATGDVSLNNTAPPPGEECFTCEARVAVPDGQRKIAEFQIGDEVIGYNPETGESVTDTVTKVSKVTHDNLITLRLADGSEITSTRDHPYYVAEKGWASFAPARTTSAYSNYATVAAMDIGDRLVTADGTVELVKTVDSPASQTTYTLTLAQSPAFIVEGVVVGVEQVHGYCTVV